MTRATDSRIDEKARLTMVHRKGEIDHLFDGPWVTLYQHERGAVSSGARFCAPVHASALPKVLAERSWDLHIGGGGPGYVVTGGVGGGTVSYERFSREGVEPLVLVRDFLGLKPRGIELSEEFRLFHDLYLDVASGQLLKIDEAGDDEVVAEIGPDSVRVRKRPLLQFVAAKQAHLALYFEYDETLPSGPNPLSAEELADEEVAEPDRIWVRYSTDLGGRSLSRLMGKRIFGPPRLPKSDEIWQPSKDFESFIIGFDEMGETLLHRSEPDRLANYFGANKGQPHYLTPVHFSRSVLDKYYADPDRYSVRDGYVQHKHMWGMRVDNDRPDRVIAFLGDLGRDLPHKEQLHWKSHNIPPDGSMSEAAFRRSFLGEPASPSSPEHVFKNRYESFQAAWRKAFGWDLFRPLSGEDAHVIERLHVPSTSGNAEFEIQVVGLSKLIVDSLNDAELAKAMGGSLEGEKSLAKFERFLTLRGYAHVARDIEVLRSLQAIRSTGAAHRKGDGYAKIAARVGISERGTPAVFAGFLNAMRLMMVDLTAHFL